MKKINPFGLFKFLSSLAVALYFMIQFFESYEKKQLFLMLVMSLFFGIFLITEIIPSYLDSITKKQFTVSISFLAGVLVIVITPYFWELSLVSQKVISVFMALVCVSVGIGLAYPLRKLKRNLDKRNLIN